MYGSIPAGNEKMNSEEKINNYINNLIASTKVLNNNAVNFHNEEKLENFISTIKPLLKGINNDLVKELSKAIYDYNIALDNYNKRNNTNYKGIGNSFRKAGIEGTNNKFSVKSYFNY